MGEWQAPRRRLGAARRVSVRVMNLHRLAEERSLGYHGWIAERLTERPEILEIARRRVAEWMIESAPPPYYAIEWSQILAGDTASIARFLVERSERAIELRQSTPFAGAIDPQSRWEIWRSVREEMERKAS